jgi:hypothetical protein
LCGRTIAGKYSQVPLELSELKRQSQKALVDFLSSEVKLAHTFRDIAKNTHGPGRRAKLLDDIRKAVSTIRHFEVRITDPAVRKALNDEADKLDALLSEDKRR